MNLENYRLENRDNKVVSKSISWEIKVLGILKRENTSWNPWEREKSKDRNTVFNWEKIIGKLTFPNTLLVWKLETVVKLRTILYMWRRTNYHPCLQANSVEHLKVIAYFKFMKNILNLTGPRTLATLNYSSACKLLWIIHAVASLAVSPDVAWNGLSPFLFKNF